MAAEPFGERRPGRLRSFVVECGTDAFRCPLRRSEHGERYSDRRLRLGVLGAGSGIRCGAVQRAVSTGWRDIHRAVRTVVVAGV